MIKLQKLKKNGYKQWLRSIFGEFSSSITIIINNLQVKIINDIDKIDEIFSKQLYTIVSTQKLQSSFSLMLSLTVCQAHNIVADKICGADGCRKILCIECFLQHSENSQHCTAVSLNRQSLTFFSTFTGYTHYKLFEWIDLLRKEGFSSLFQPVMPQGSLLSEIGSHQKTANIGIKVLEQYQHLMQCNRQFVLNHMWDSEICHPEFLKDLFNLVTDKWEVSANVICDNLNHHLKEAFKGSQIELHYKIVDKYLLAIEANRLESLNKFRKSILFLATEIKNCKQQNPIGEGYQQSVNSAIPQVEQQIEYSVPYSIQQIQSYEVIGQPHKRQCNHKSSVYIVQAQNKVEYEKQNKPEITINQEQFLALMKQLQQLRAENISLKSEVHQVRSENQNLREEKQRFLSQMMEQGKRQKQNIYSQRTTLKILNKRTLRVIE